jgi:2-oxoacid:acceptor oxidoreductase gamma subunit (pyruvate/2-ketoisovalerate family)
MTKDIEDKIYELIFHGRGGQGAITAAELMCEVAYKDGMVDVLSIPIIGAERRGAPIKAFNRLSTKREIKNYAAPTHPDVVIIFDMSLLPLPGVLDSLKDCIVILNTSEDVDISKFSSDVKIYTVDATGISIELGLIIAGSPVLNVPLLGAYAKIMGHIKLETIKTVLEGKFGSKAELNYLTAKKAFETTKTVRA